MIILKKILWNIHRYLLWAVISVVLWAWIYMLATDTTKAKKVVVYIDAPEVAEQGLMLELEKDLPEGIRMVKVRSFEYLEYSVLESEEADIYILPEEKFAAALEFLAQAPGTDGYGSVICDPDSGLTIAGSYITYGEGRYYICFSKKSVHLGEANGSKDDAAITIAERILALP